MYCNSLKKNWLSRVIVFLFGFLLVFIGRVIFQPYTAAAFERALLFEFLASVTDLALCFIMGFSLLVITLLPAPPRDSLCDLQNCTIGRCLTALTLLIVPGQFAWHLYNKAYFIKCGDDPYSICAPSFFMGTDHFFSRSSVAVTSNSTVYRFHRNATHRTRAGAG